MARSRRPVALETNRRGPETPAVSYLSARLYQPARAASSDRARAHWVTESLPRARFEQALGRDVGRWSHKTFRRSPLIISSSSSPEPRVRCGQAVVGRRCRAT